MPLIGQPRHSWRSRLTGCASRSVIVDGRVVAVTARLSARAQRIKVVFVAGPLARKAVDEGMAPGILRHLLALDVGPIPALDPLRRDDQGRESLIACRIVTNIELVDIEHAGQALD